MCSPKGLMQINDIDEFTCEFYYVVECVLDSWSESVFGMCFRFTRWVDKLIDPDSVSDQPIHGAEPLLSI